MAEISHSTTDKDQRLRRAYDRSAAVYDVDRYQSAEGRFFSDFESDILMAWLRPSEGLKILDLPAGTGRLTIPLVRAGATVVAGDISQNMLQVASAASSREGLTRAHFAQLNGARLPFRDDTFDVVTSFKFFHLIPNERKPVFLAEMTRVVKPGGKLVVEFNSPFYGVFLAFYRYYFRKRKPGRMRTKCLFPDQVGELFRGLVVRRKLGVKLPLSGWLARLVGARATEMVNLAVGRIPGLRYLTYAMVIEAEKAATPVRAA